MSVTFDDDEIDINDYILQSTENQSSEIVLNNPLAYQIRDSLMISSLTHLEITNASYEALAESLNTPLSNHSTLKYLFLINCNLEKLPEGITQLNNLELLDLSKNDFSVFPKEIIELRSLRYLCIGPKAIQNVPKEMANLQNLTFLSINANDKLRIKNNQVDFPMMIRNGNTFNISELYNFKQIEALDLAGTLSEVIEKIDFSQFKKLKNLSIWGCNLSAPPDSIYSLTELETLDMGSNQLSSFPSKCLKIQSLRHLCLFQNKIKIIPAEIRLCNFVETRNIDLFLGLELRQNPIENIPLELLGKGFLAIKAYFDAIENGVKVSFNAAKLMLVGRGGVGKTSLIKKLKSEDFQVGETAEVSTRGIDISEWTFKMANNGEFEARIWDFGGQSHYLSPHQFFLTQRSVYLVVWDAREEDDFQFDDWLNLIKTMSNSSPVILVMNKCDERIKSIDEAGLKKRFPNILNFHKVSCIENVGVDALRFEVKRALTELAHVNDKLPFTWKHLRDQLEGEGKSNDYLSVEDYYQRCQKHGLKKEESDVLSSYLHDLGTMIHFNKIPLLKDTLILNSKWLTDAIYTIIDDLTITNQHGKFTYDDLIRLWDKNIYPENKHAMMLKLLEKYGICFETSEYGDYLTPHLLSPSQPEITLLFSNSLHFQYKYAFLPNGLMTKFIIRNHQKFQTDSIMWRHGVFQKMEGVELLIYENRIEKTIHLQVNGKDSKKYGTMLWLIEEIKNLNQFYTNLEVKQLVACKCDTCKNAEKPHFHEVPNLLNRLNTHKVNPTKKDTIECPISTDDIKIVELIQHFNFDEEISRSLVSSDSPNIKRIFISYSSEDIEYLNAFKEAISPLKRLGKAITWDDNDLRGGEIREETIIKNLQEADIIVFLISSKLIATTFIWEKEMPLALKRHQNKEAVVIPIILRPCDWTNLPIAKLNAFPRKGVPITDKKEWGSEDEAWTEVVMGIKKLL